MYMNGCVTIKLRTHQGLMHEAAVILHGLGEVIFGSSNWARALELPVDHNYFYTPSINKVVASGKTFYQWFADQFNGKWNNTVAFAPFQPIPPNAPVYSAPVNGRGVRLYGHAAMGRRLLGSQVRHLFRNELDPAADRDRRHDRRPGPERGGEHIASPIFCAGTTYYWRDRR